MRYQLNPMLSWCICAGRAVFLDLGRDRYFCLPVAEDVAFRQWAFEEPVADRACLERLAGREVLTSGRHTLATRPASITPAGRDLGAEREGKAHLRDIAAAVLAQKRAEWLVRHRPVAAVVQGILQTRPVVSASRAALPEARRVANALSTTALMLRKTDRCLPRALAAYMLCARLRLSASLVFGVRLEPFAAHCWVQWRDAVVVGDAEDARMFTPILVLP